MSQNSLDDCTREWFGFAVQSKRARFKSKGWFGTGQTGCNCTDCGDPLWAFRKPYTTSKGDYLYWALVCSRCRTAIDPASLTEGERKQLYKSSEHHSEKQIPPSNTITKASETTYSEPAPVRIASDSGKNAESQCITCKHAKYRKSESTCVALQVEIDFQKLTVGCVHYTNSSNPTAIGAEFIDQAMKDRSGQQQQPDKFSTDKTKFFNKIKRK